MKFNTSILVMSKEELELLLDEKLDKLAQLLTNAAHSPGKRDDGLLSRKQAAEYLQVSLPTLHTWTNKKVVKSMRIQGRVYYSKEDYIDSKHKKISILLEHGDIIN